jgi:hypothetical protein
MLRWRYHGNVPLERFVLGIEVDLLHEQNRYESYSAVQENRDEPSLDVSAFMASGAM